MTGMRFIGPYPRAVALRGAANRLRWEIDFALGVAPGCTEPHRSEDAGSALMLSEIAATVAILRRALDSIDEHAEVAGLDRGRVRAQFQADVRWLFTCHEVAR